MENQFTQGPWIYDDSQRYYSTRVVRMNGVVVCNPVHQSTMQQTEYDANVRLIAAAPALYEVLEIIASNADQAANGGLKIPSKAQSMGATKEVLRRIRDRARAALALVDSKNGEL